MSIVTGPKPAPSDGGQVIELPCSTFYCRSTATSECLNDGRLIELIESIQDELPDYGCRRVRRELRRRGHVVNHKRVAVVMRAQDLGTMPRRRFVRTVDSKHASPILPNLYRNVIPTQPNVVWVADFTYIRIAMGFC
ncbi:IS3 family transposase [Variovorax sp. UC74_104]|uniref:IS3 family transposase n=1 Tax=Variovorax sp. UC74_104 TaxID=3374555 RepID=UPI0037565D52